MFIRNRESGRLDSVDIAVLLHVQCSVVHLLLHQKMLAGILPASPGA